MALADIKLDDKYTLDTGRVYLTGVQALTRLPMLQQQRDQQAGLNTAGFISGYRGSPLGGLDKELWKAGKYLDQHHINFQPGLNEDMAATAVWGTQQVNLFEGARYDGVFSMWYGKGPGIDRSGDVFKHANAAGTSPHGGVLVIAGDDHNSKSSTLPHQTEYAFMDAMIPVLNPAGVQEILDYGQIGWALSRYSGCWVALKTIAETVDTSASVSIDPKRVQITIPDDYELPEGGLNIRWPHTPLEQESLQHRHRLYAALAFARVNKLNRIVIDTPTPRLGIATTGKSYLDVMQALEDLGITPTMAAQIGIRLYKIGMSWPLEREGVRQFAEGLDEILVVEEKRGLIENQIKEQLYNWKEAVRPKIVGKFDESNQWLLPSAGELTPARIARVIAARIERFHQSEVIEKRLHFLQKKEAELALPRVTLDRVPHFCSGCPHNTSTLLPEGSRATGGIGCHYMATWMDRGTDTFTQMGGEGVPWIGQAPFTDTPHIFANLGEGTYFHSGVLAIRAALAANVNITYKILYNDAVAMTGGQPVDGSFSVQQLSRQLAAEGVKRIALVSDDPDKFKDRTEFAPDTTFDHRDNLEKVQRELRETPGVSVLIYEQTCAAEKRRRRKRGLLNDPKVRPFINSAICENCGDCSTQSNCLSIIPVETEFGRKRAIDQSSCNKDMRCVEGYCPSFVTVHGGQLKRVASQPDGLEWPDLPLPELPGLERPHNILLTGIGGTGVVTIGALLGMAAHIDGRGVTVLDMTGLAQKYGAVVSHIRIAVKPEDIHAMRIAAGQADTLLACDLAVATGFEAMAKLNPERTDAVINSHQAMTSGFIKQKDLTFPAPALEAQLEKTTRHAQFINASQLAESLLGDAIGANLFMVGFAWQKGYLPLSLEALKKAIELNGVSIQDNLRALLWGRRAAVDLEAVQQLAAPDKPAVAAPKTLDELIAHRSQHLTDHQNAAYARRYRQLVERVREREQVLGLSGLTEAVAENYARLLAYKDEYEVARLYSDRAFREQIANQFEGDFHLEFHFDPPILSKADPETGKHRKRRFGPWMLKMLGLLRHLKVLRGSRLDPFGNNPDRQLERALIEDYETTLETLLSGLNRDNLETAIALARLPEEIRGFGHVKQAAAEQAAIRQQALLNQLLGNTLEAQQAA
ncbi:indolepyruvate ferredoxin oxidoreductase family protein [Sedimenticola thiotaurini]|uniref:Indolepyruvate ferredoxin oxidoreductase n=1 Tax=Sedimenticola thiotaurini TaxID=1543721 RepID=A0A0F7JWB3_9GAMM|nr:indolepyruvate ferredoxin oxidoreductase family protein [Sedimenticola thiotaurini]AKH19947.1 indolepyruvate ferredoxin oxidoreductase [Sedimenticola thiotaurini]